VDLGGQVILSMLRLQLFSLVTGGRKQNENSIKQFKNHCKLFKTIKYLQENQAM
jgi:hypothetical protein